MKKKKNNSYCSGNGVDLRGQGWPDAVQNPGEIAFADVGWDSVKFHNAVAGLVAESAFGYTWKEMPGSSPIMHEALKTVKVM